VRDQVGEALTFHVISTHTSQQAEHAEAVAAVRAGLKPRGAVRRTRLWSVRNQTVAPRRWRAAPGETETGGGDDRSDRSTDENTHAASPPAYSSTSARNV